MKVLILTIALALYCVECTEIDASTAVAVRIPAHKDECFFEDVRSSGAKIYVHYMVTSGGSLDIDANILGPDGQIIWASEKERENRILFKARLPGIHKVCFSNKMSTLTAKVVGFSIQVGDPTESTKDHEVDPMERAITHISRSRLW